MKAKTLDEAQTDAKSDVMKWLEVIQAHVTNIETELKELFNLDLPKKHRDKFLPLDEKIVSLDRQLCIVSSTTSQRSKLGPSVQHGSLGHK